jgi:PAS domain S-box-containing protein
VIFAAANAAPAGDDPSVARDLQVEATQRLMEALVQAENQMRRRVQILSEVVFELDGERRLVFLNDAWRATTGQAVETSLGRPLADFLQAADRVAFTDWLTHGAPETGEALRRYRLERADGREIWVEVSARPLAEGGAVGVLRDVTERRAREGEQRRVQRLQSIGTLAGGIAHDLNNTLLPILMGLDLLRARFPDQAPLLDPMVASAEHGAAMVRQVLTFARGVETQQQVIEPLRLIDDIAKILRSSFARNVAIATHCPRGLPRLVGDFTQLHQVLLNLCVNARDAMPQGGRLTLTAGALPVTPGVDGAPEEARAGLHVVFEVADTGCGITPEVLERMFEPFFTTKGPDKGTGLGLSTVLGIVRSHGGFVRVQTVVGEGSKFQVFLPQAQESPAVGDRAATPVSKAGVAPALRVLFVDDDESVRAVARVALIDLGHEVALAADGAAALAHVNSGVGVDVVVTDLDMPACSGLELARSLRAAHPRVPVIVCSGRLHDEDIDALRAVGVGQFLAKPFTRERLAAAVRAAFEVRPAGGNL